jgi:signal transduction histidine kinase
MLGLIGLGFVVLAAGVLAHAGLRRDRRLLTASGVSLTMLAATPMVMDLREQAGAGMLMAGSVQLVALLLVARAAGADVRFAIATAARYDVDLRLRLRHAVAKGEEMARLQHERNHEIRSALLAVEGAGTMLTRRYADLGYDADAQLARSVQLEAGRLQRLLAATVDDPPAAFDIAGVLEPLVAAHRATGQRVTLDVPASARAVGRPHVLAEVVSNLLVNAARHAPGAVVAITAPMVAPRGMVRLVVADDGPGFADGGLAHATERGWRAEGTTAPGSGLGLFLTAQLMAQEGGALTLLPPAPGTSGAVVALDLAAATAAPSDEAGTVDDVADAS